MQGKSPEYGEVVHESSHFHALKRSNAYNTEDKSQKRNSKMLKLRHLYNFVGPKM